MDELKMKKQQAELEIKKQQREKEELTQLRRNRVKLAAAALQGLLAGNPEAMKADPLVVATRAVVFADAVLGKLK